MKAPIVIKIENVDSKIFNANGEVVDALDIGLSYYKEGYRWAKAYKNKWWDGKVHKFKKNTRTFPTGLLNRVTKILRKFGYTYGVVDLRKKPKRRLSQVADNLEYYKVIPRPYQYKGIAKGMKHQCMMFWWPTASGKTILFGGLIVAYDLPTLILVNRKDLVDQHVDFLKKNTSMKIGFISEGDWKPGYVTVATTQSLWALRHRDKNMLTKFLSGIGYLLIDEAHHGEAKTFRTPAEDCINASVRHGFSGTPYSLSTDDMELECVTGPVLSKISISYLIKNGFLSIPNITMNRFKSPEIDSQSWIKVYREGIVNNEKRNKIACEIIRIRYENNLQILVTVREKKHGWIIKDMLPKFGINKKEIVYLSGDDIQEHRLKFKKKFDNREIRVVIVTSIWNEGVDIPSANALVKMDGGGSKDVIDERGVRTTIQQIGRVLRKEKSPGQSDVDRTIPQIAYVDDFMDSCHPWLDNHSHNRYATFKIEEAFVLKEEVWK